MMSLKWSQLTVLCTFAADNAQQPASNTCHQQKQMAAKERRDRLRNSHDLAAECTIYAMVRVSAMTTQQLDASSTAGRRKLLQGKSCFRAKAASHQGSFDAVCE